MVFVFPSVLGSNCCIALRGTWISCASYRRRIALPYSVRRVVKHAFSKIKLSFDTVVKQLVLPGSGHGSKCCSMLPSGAVFLPLDATQIASSII